MKYEDIEIKYKVYDTVFKLIADKKLLPCDIYEDCKDCPFCKYIFDYSEVNGPDYYCTWKGILN